MCLDMSRLFSVGQMGRAPCGPGTRECALQVFAVQAEELSSAALQAQRDGAALDAPGPAALENIDGVHVA